MLQLLYTLLISPPELVIEVLFVVLNRIFSDPGTAIIGVSILVNILILPLYRRADALQKQTRDREQALSHWSKHIRKAFSGDMRFMMLSEYYRQNHYKPYHALKSSLSLLLQIPFFIAAYRFLSGLTLLNGVSFLFIENLALPDGLLVFRSHTVHLLPILMTLVNLASAAIYLKGALFKQKLQVYGMAFLFLILLYRSPSGLVLYWTCNNLFSLLKNIMTRLAWLPKRPAPHVRIPEWRGDMARASSGQIRRLFIGCCLLLTFLTGLLIPSAVIAASPEEFITLTDYVNPLVQYLPHTFCLAAGFFLVWAQVFYSLSTERGKRIASLSALPVSCVCLVNYLFFGRDYGILTSDLRYSLELHSTLRDKLLNIIFLFFLFAFITLLMIRFLRRMRLLLAIIFLSILFLSVIQIIETQTALTKSNVAARADALRTEQEEPVIPLSTEGKNVIVIMLDRAFSKFAPFVFAELPDVKKQFEGFTYYPNTISYGGFTIYGIPGLYGGYEYIPAEMNKRTDALLVDKHNDALRVMPVLFSSRGFTTTVFDQPYGNYETFSDLSIYDAFPEINVYQTHGRYVSSANAAMITEQNKRNFFCYSMMHCAPVFLHKLIYDNGDYLSSNQDTLPPAGEFLHAYTSLTSLMQWTSVRQDTNDTFLIYDNLTTHEPTPLQMPNYTLSYSVNNNGFNTSYRLDDEGNLLDLSVDPLFFNHYCSYAASLKSLGEWFDHLRACDVYDNTRIIIVADHGYIMGLFPELGSPVNYYVSWYNPLLMVKDFGASGFSTDDTFMTNADTPYLATENLIDSPVNPFTGNPLSSDSKNTRQYIWVASQLPDYHALEYAFPATHDFFQSGDIYWLGIHNNIFNPDNWEEILEEVPSN